MKKLNRKGFTLIELLAVIVILAVVMGIAVNSVLTSMNKARGGATADTAQIIANAFNQKYTEELVGGSPATVYKDALSIGGYNFSSTAAYNIYAGLADTFNISGNTYKLTATPQQANGITDISSTNESFVVFDGNNARFVVCMVIQQSSPNYVNAYTTKESVAVTVGNDNGNAGKTVTITASENAPIMFACSNGQKSWS